MGKGEKDFGSMATFSPTDERSINTWIKQRRHALDLTQEELAERVGCSGITIQKIELGYRRPSKQIAQRLAECLQVPPDERDEFISRVRGEKGDAESLVFEAPASDRADIEPAGYSTRPLLQLRSIYPRL